MTPDIIIISITSLLFGLMLIPTSLRLLSKERVVFHLLLYISLGLAANLSILLPDSKLVTPRPRALSKIIPEPTRIALALTLGV
jgi:hypothetical protein